MPPETRESRHKILLDHFAVESWADSDHTAEPGELERWAAVTGVGEYEHAHIATFPLLAEAFEHIAGEVLDGLAPDGVYDLDEGRKIDIHVSTPIVTASEDQGITVNPLERENEIC